MSKDKTERSVIRWLAGLTMAGVFVVLTALIGKAPRLPAEDSELLLWIAFFITSAIGATAVAFEVVREVHS
jgi:uncharacterized membrane-anchored protein